MRVDNLLSKLDKVKRTGNGKWIACCPAHNDKSPSMVISEVNDERILIHCFAGCSPDEIMGAVGMGMTDLFPERLMDKGEPIRRPFAAADVLEALSTETLLVHITASRLSKGEKLDSDEYKRLVLASCRIEAGRRMALG